MRRELKVCLASMAPFVGGAEVAVERLALGLREAGHNVFLLLGRTGAVQQRLEKAGLRCVISPMFFTDKWHWWRYLRARSALRRLFRHERPAVIHSNDLPTHQIVSHAARGLDVARICHHRFPFDGKCLDWLNKYGAERHLFVSRALMEELAAKSPRLEAHARAVVYDGLPLPPLPAQADTHKARARLGLSPEKVLILYAGQIIERKGVADLLRAWAALDDAVRQRAELILIGDDLEGQGQYRVAMERLAGDLGCPVQFRGFQKSVGDWLEAADIAVVPSHVEPLGNATLEAMSYGRPVIGCAVGGIPEMIVAEETGLLVPPRAPEQLGAALRRLVADGDLRQRLGLEGRRRCEEQFTLEAHARGVLQQYEKALSSVPVTKAS
jgi:glycosyltransferase involved in cell wall biosynthesis